MNIADIKGREILDSRGTPTVEVEILLSNGIRGHAAVPSGASTGENEALELRDMDKRRYNGKGVQKAVENIRTKIAPRLKGMCVFNQREIDHAMIELDNSDNKKNMGANAILGVSLAVAKAAANALNIPLFRYLGGVNAHTLPIPMMNIVNGGRHSDAPIAFQEFMIRPIGASSFHEALRYGSEIFHTLKNILHKRGMSTAVGDEGGFAPDFENIESVLDCIVEAIEQSGYKPYEDITIALDCAASEYYVDGIYNYGIFERTQRKLNAEQQAEYLSRLVSRYPIDSIEDGMAQNDWEGWQLLTRLLGKRCQLVGDDLFVTNTKYLREGIENSCGNSILIKPNQIGSLSETLDVIELAKRNGYSTIISHRSGETEDTTIADIAVATNAGQIKTGSMSRSERISKYNRLLRIEEFLNQEGFYGYR